MAAAPARPMTGGEIDMARSIFGAAVDYARVSIHGSGFLWFNMQHRDMALSPDGNIYFTAHRYLDDFSARTDSDRHWFMHEMAHVWQHQLGYPVRLRGAIRLGLSYDYELSAGLSLCDYNMEAQAELLSDYFLLRFLQGADTAVYDTALEPFLTDPSNPCHLPGARRAA